MAKTPALRLCLFLGGNLALRIKEASVTCVVIVSRAREDHWPENSNYVLGVVWVTQRKARVARCSVYIVWHLCNKNIMYYSRHLEHIFKKISIIHV